MRRRSHFAENVVQLNTRSAPFADVPEMRSALQRELARNLERVDLDRERLQSDLAALTADRQHVQAELEALTADRQHVQAELDALTVEKARAEADRKRASD